MGFYLFIITVELYEKSVPSLVFLTCWVLGTKERNESCPNTSTTDISPAKNSHAVNCPVGNFTSEHFCRRQLHRSFFQQRNIFALNGVNRGWSNGTWLPLWSALQEKNREFLNVLNRIWHNLESQIFVILSHERVLYIRNYCLSWFSWFLNHLSCHSLNED